MTILTILTMYTMFCKSGDNFIYLTILVTRRPHVPWLSLTLLAWITFRKLNYIVIRCGRLQMPRTAVANTLLPPAYPPDVGRKDSALDWPKCTSLHGPMTGTTGTT
jgi:hypothetical protein